MVELRVVSYPQQQRNGTESEDLTRFSLSVPCQRKDYLALLEVAQQAQPRFTRRLRTGLDEQQASYPPQAFEVWVVLGNLENVVDGEVGRRTQRVESLDSPAGGATAR